MHSYVIGLVLLALGLFVGIVSYEITLAVIVIGAVLAVVGSYMLIRGRRPAA